MSDGESRDDAGELAHRPGDQQQPDQEHRVVPTGEDVLHAEPEVPEGGIGGRSGAGGLERPIPGVEPTGWLTVDRHHGPMTGWERVEPASGDGDRLTSGT